MLFRELLNKEFITEAKLKKSLKIFYKFNLDLYKNGIDTEQPQINQMQEPVQSQPEQQTQEPIQQPVEVQPQQLPGDEQQNNASMQPNQAPVLPSVVTEDEVSVNDENKILRKFDGEVELTDSQKDTIQTLDDIISILSEHKKDGENILDEFSTEIVQLLYSPNSQELNSKIDKKSSIFVEIFYGYKKDDSVGVRFNKRKNSDTLTSTMLIDNEIISTPFSVVKVDQKISEIRNYEVKD